MYTGPTGQGVRFRNSHLKISDFKNTMSKTPTMMVDSI